MEEGNGMRPSLRFHGHDTQAAVFHLRVGRKNTNDGGWRPRWRAAPALIFSSAAMLLLLGAGGIGSQETPPQKPPAKIKKVKAPKKRAAQEAEETSAPSTKSDAASEIIFEDIKVQVLSDQKVAYRIVAASGRMNEDTRVISMDRPDVKIFDENEQIKQKIASRQGRLWPVKIEEVLDDGTKREVSKYDWELDGEVIFDSSEGHEVKSPELIFSSKNRNITSRKGVEYRIPSGRGSVFSGRANEFEALIDPETGAMSGWTLTGNVVLSAASGKAAEGEETAPLANEGSAGTEPNKKEENQP